MRNTIASAKILKTLEPVLAVGIAEPAFDDDLKAAELQHCDIDQLRALRTIEPQKQATHTRVSLVVYRCCASCSSCSTSSVHAALPVAHLYITAEVNTH
jgi:hypothetical protein